MVRTQRATIDRSVHREGSKEDNDVFLALSTCCVISSKSLSDSQLPVKLDEDKDNSYEVLFRKNLLERGRRGRSQPGWVPVKLSLGLTTTALGGGVREA